MHVVIHFIPLTLSICLSVCDASIIGYVYIADTGNNVIRMVDTNGIITTIAGNGTAGYNGDIFATNTQLNAPKGVAVYTSSGTMIASIYIALHS